MGSRLGAIGKKEPKCLLTINGKPFLAYQLERLEKQNISKVILSVGYMAERFQSFVDNQYEGNIEILLSHDGNTPLGTGGAIKEIISSFDTPCFAMYGDSFLNIKFSAVQRAYQFNAGPLLTIFHNKNLYDSSNVYFDGSKILYKKNVNDPSFEYIDYGLSIFHRDHFNNFPKVFDLASVQEYFSSNGNLQFFLAEERFYEIGTPESYQATSLFLSKHEYS